jgi:hypothetical protein
MLAFLVNLIATPATIVFSYTAVGAWVLYSAITGFGIEMVHEDSDKASEISVTEDLSLEEKADEQVNSLLERENADLRNANQRWFEKYEELHAENKDLKSEVGQVRTMLYTVGCICMIMLWSYGLIVYMHILTLDLAKK